MTQRKPFRETMTEIGNAFGFHDIQLDELEKYYELEFNSRPYDKERANAILFLRYYSDETANYARIRKTIRTNSTSASSYN